MAKSSNAVFSTNGSDRDHAVVEKLKADVSRYKNRCRALLAQIEAFKNPDVAAAAAGERRKSSDGGGSDTSARLHRFQRLAQTVKSATDAEKSSKVTLNGKKLIIQQPQQQQHVSGSPLDHGKLKHRKK